MSLGLNWAEPQLIHLLWLAFAVTGLLVFLEVRSSRQLGAFMSRAMQKRLASAPSPGQRIARLVCIGLCLIAGVLAVMRPQSRTSKETLEGLQVSGDVMVVLDVSKSMLAEDAAPNRLKRAKAEISQMVDKLRGHRVGLIVFAGKAAILSPLTPDYSFFRMMLRGASPTSVSRGGTAIGEALRLAVAAFDGDTVSSARMVLLITDGEDHDSYPREAAKAAKEASIRVVTVGLGSEEGAPIVVTDPSTNEKKSIVSRVDGALLREIAVTTDGAYIPAGTAALDLDSIVRKHIVPLLRDAAPTTTRFVARELYPWPVLASLIFLLVSVIVVAPTRRRST